MQLFIPFIVINIGGVIHHQTNMFNNLSSICGPYVDHMWTNNMFHHYTDHMTLAVHKVDKWGVCYFLAPHDGDKSNS
jgi:hypothetical protein